MRLHLSVLLPVMRQTESLEDNTARADRLPLFSHQSGDFMSFPTDLVLEHIIKLSDFCRVLYRKRLT